MPLNAAQIIAHWKATALAVRNPLTVGELVRKYIEYRSKGGEPTTQGDIRTRTMRFSGMYYTRKAHAITPKDIRDFLDLQEDQNSRRNDYKVVSPMFDRASEQGVVASNPCAEIKRPKAKHSEIEILKIEEFAKLLKVADGDFPNLLPGLILGGFAGLRACEMLRERSADQVVVWTDLYDWSLLEIRGKVAKQNRA